MGRTLLWVIPVLLIIAIGIGAIAWYARSNYFVGANLGRVTVYKGVPGGLLWLDPTIDHRTNLRLSDLRPVDAVNVRRGEQTFGSKSDADAYIRRIRAKGETRRPPPPRPPPRPPRPSAPPRPLRHDHGARAMSEATVSRVSRRAASGPRAARRRERRERASMSGQHRSTARGDGAPTSSGSGSSPSSS